MHEIYTIGYQGMTINRLTEIMEEKDITKLIDVRSKPFSRNVQFNRNNLARVLGDLYLWKGDILGGLSGPASEEGIAFLLIIRQTETVLIMCMEKSPLACHRFYDISRRLYQEAGIDAIHLVDLGNDVAEQKTSDYLGGP
jgi:uncharacterized protein (DUF488 family)